MNTLKIRKLELGAGLPKICVPVTGNDIKEILSRGQLAVNARPDLIEWRIDHFDGFTSPDAIDNVLTKLREMMNEIPLLVTFRTLEEGGEKAILPADYLKLNTFLASHAAVDLIDVELLRGDEILTKLVQEAHAHNTFVIASSHDFQKTPAEDEIIRRLCRMQELGADVTKIAVMPQTSEDVLTLLHATAKMRDLYADRPFITMSMASTGMISRLCGEVFGSALTFGTAGHLSAPGQIPADQLRQVLEIIHNNL